MSKLESHTKVLNPDTEKKAAKSIRSTQADSSGPVIKHQKTSASDEDRDQRKYGAKFWGPYLSDRQWGTVREDCSPDFSCWDDFSHDAAVHRVYRWGEDGLMGVSDQENKLCAGLALWNGKDDILKERLFGLTNPEGNHGEDVKELYYCLYNTPDHTYMEALYRYPHSAFPYKELRAHKQERTQGELEILDTGVFDNDAFWDIYIEYSKDIPGSILCRYTVYNRSNNESSLVLIPQMWFRNTWSGTASNATKPYFFCNHGDLKLLAVYELGEFQIQFSSDTDQPQVVLTDNEDIFTGCDEQDQLYRKDGFHQFVVHGQKSAVKMEGKGTKCCAVYKLKLPPGGEKKVYWSIYPSDKGGPENIHLYCDLVINKRKLEGESYYNGKFPECWTEEERNVALQAYAGLLWSKQFYNYDVQKQWQQIVQPSLKKTDFVKQTMSSVQDDECEEVSLKSDKVFSQENKELTLLTVEKSLSKNEGKGTETTVSKIEIDDNVEEVENYKEKEVTKTWNSKWPHFQAHDILSVPDKWEFPWFATWDTGFQMIPIARLDAEFAKQQLLLLLSDRYMHPSGQMPGCEFNLSDMNPSVHAWACLKVYKITGSSDLHFIQKCYERLKINYNWMKATAVGGGCLYSGGFLGMDNISVVDRSHPPEGASLEQADGTGWMAMYSLNMLELSLELERYNADTTEDAVTYLSHFLSISQALNLNIQNGGLWSDTDEFYYDVMVTKMSREVIRVQSLVGLVPILACMKIKTQSCSPSFLKSLQDVSSEGSPFVWKGADDTYVLSAVPVTRLRSIVKKMFSQQEFLSPFGIRSLSKVHEDHPFEMEIKGKTYSVRYAAGESDTDLFGGNSNWRGPVWLCMNYILVEALEIHHLSTPGVVNLDDGNKELTLEDCVQEICRHIVSLFLPDSTGHRPIHGGSRRYSCDPHWKNLVLFYEYFHGDTGSGCGASHQTGWTSLVIEFLHKVKDMSGQLSRPV